MWDGQRRAGDRETGGRSPVDRRRTDSLTLDQPGIAERSLPSRSRRSLEEFGLMALLVALYCATRGVAAGLEGTAFENANRIMGLEHRLGIFWELGVQSWALAIPAVARALNLVYTLTHLPGLLLFAAWILLWHNHRYREIRNVFLAILAGGLLVYILFPVAPPRLFLASGFVDMLALFSRINFNQPSIAPIYNPFAAMPSLHVAFALFCGIGVIQCGGKFRHWLIGVLYPAFMIAAVIATGNHFILDVVAGATLTIIAYLLVPRLSRF